MKRILMLAMAMGSMIMAQDIAGNYRVSALDVQYYDIARQSTDINVSDAYGMGVSVTLTTINAGDLFYGTHSGPYNEATLAAIGVNLNVNFYEDGSCVLAEGSYYPDVNEENCVSSVQVLPITDDMVYSSDLTNLSPTPSTNLIGLPSISARAGDYAGGLSLNEALIFDYFPQGANGYANQFGPDLTPFTGDELAPVSIPVQVNYPTGDVYPANTPLPGVHGGWVNKGDLGDSQIPTSTVAPDLFAEWHAIDGEASESGLGDFIGQDEDGYDGDFDRTFGLPVLPEATYISDHSSCSAVLPSDLGSTPIAGDITEVIHGGVYMEGMGICAAAGGPVNSVAGMCIETAGTPEFLAGCEYAGVAASVTGACESLGFPSDLCAGGGAAAAGMVAGACSDMGVAAGYPPGFSCADLGTSDCAVLTSAEFSTGLCGYLASEFTTSETCEEWSLGLADGFVSNCIAGVDVATQMYVMDPSGASAAYGNFVTFNGVLASQGAAGCAVAGLDIESCIAAGAFNPAWLQDDSGHEADPACLADGDPSDCSGRVLFSFAPTCIPEIEVRQVVIEAVELESECLADGDANLDGTTNVLDVVQIVQHILGNSSLSDDGACNADFNQDGTVNVLDVVSIVQSILGNRATSASAVELNKSNAGVNFDADGYVGAIQMTLSHGEDFSFELTEKALVADSKTENNSTTIIVVNPEDGEIFTSEGSFNIETVVAASADGYIDTQINVPAEFTISNAYPNPFNPSTSLSVELTTDADVSVKVFNVMGQLVDVVSEGQMTAGTHAFTWDASSVASGVYFINTEVGSALNSQKVMLLK